MEAVRSLLANKSVLVLNAGDVDVMPKILQHARQVHVVDSKGRQWTQKQAMFERANPLRYSLTEPVDVVWSNINLEKYAQDDIVQLVGYVNKLAQESIFALPTQKNRPFQDNLKVLEDTLQTKELQISPNFTIISKSLNSQEKTEEDNVVSAWTDREMPLIWRDSIYTGKCAIMTELYNAQKEYVTSLMAPNRPNSYVEVGCGTSEMGSVLYDRMAYTVGVEINPVMLDLAKDIHPEMNAHRGNYLLEGNALELESILEKSMPSDFWKSSRIVAILMNTFGILPEHIRQRVVDQMIRVAGDDGVVVIGCWHSKSFRRGVEEYYMKNPKLVGDKVTLDMCDFDSSDLWVPSSKYESHWFSESELKNFVQAYAVKGYEISTHVAGVGVFLTCKRFL
ncbi:unnamed protein product [Aphanomyces euteiches]